MAVFTYTVSVKYFVPRGRATGHEVGTFTVEATQPMLAAEAAERMAAMAQNGNLRSLSGYFAYKVREVGAWSPRYPYGSKGEEARQTMNQFRSDNTEGYTADELAHLNREYERAMAGTPRDSADSDADYAEMAQEAAERVLRLYDNGWRLGERVEAGTIAADYDTGTVVARDGDDVTVSWDSGVRTTQHGDLLRLVGTQDE